MKLIYTEKTASAEPNTHARSGARANLHWIDTAHSIKYIRLHAVNAPETSQRHRHVITCRYKTLEVHVVEPGNV